MESSNFYQLQQQQLGSFSSLAVQSIPGVAATTDGNPSLHLNYIDDYNRYMNQILPNSTEVLLRKNADMGYDEFESSPNPSTLQNAVDLNENLWLGTKQIWAYCPAAPSRNNYVFNNNSDHLAMNYVKYNGENCTHSSKEDSSLPSYDPIHCQVSSYSSSNKMDKANSRTKRVISTSSQRRASQEEAAKKHKAVSQPSSSLPKIGKEKIGDRIAALHRLVAPFGKTDTASVLTEAIGYIQFLQHQIQTLSMPCIKPSLRDRHPFQWVSREQDEKEDLRSRGLCLVPLSIASYISSSYGGLDNESAQY